MQKGVITPLIFFVVALVFGVAIGVLYFYQIQKPNSSPTNIPLIQIHATQPPVVQKPMTVNYKNDQFRFSFDYNPDQFEVKPDLEKDYFIRQNGDYRKNFTSRNGYQPAEVLAAINLVKRGETNLDNGVFVVWVFKNEDNLDVDKWFAKYHYYPFIWGIYDSSNLNKIVPKNEATVSGKLAKYGLIDYQNNTKVYLIPQNNQLFLVKVLQDKDGVGDQTLSSLRLI